MLQVERGAQHSTTVSSSVTGLFWRLCAQRSEERDRAHQRDSNRFSSISIEEEILGGKMINCGRVSAPD